MTKKEFKEMAMNLFVDKNKYEKYLCEAMESGAIDFDSLPNNYLAVYPVAAAIYKETTGWYLNGSNDPKVRRQQKKESNNIYRCL